MTDSLLALFLIVAIGLLLGQLSWRGISLDVSAVVFVALALGHFGVRIPREFQTLGLVLFIFTIGLQAGPGFFESFRKHGRSVIIIGAIIVVAGALMAGLIARVFGVDYRLATGLFTGALTSTPGLAAAIEAAQSPLASIGYGIAYPFGVVGVILFVRLLPKLLGVRPETAAAEYERETRAEYPEILNQNFVIKNPEVDGHTLRELAVNTKTRAIISRIRRGADAATPSADTRLHLGDIVKAVGTRAALENFRQLVGEPTTEEIPLSHQHVVNWVLVTNKEVVNRRLGELQLFARYDATVTRIRRSGIDLAPTAHTQLRFGDKLMIAGDTVRMPAVMKLLGNDAKRLSETDFLPIALGIVAGVLLGKIAVPLPGGIEFSLGITGGVLIAALVLSRVGKTGPIIWTMSGLANTLLRELGLLFFLASVGTEAGATLMETLAAHGATLFVAGMAITLVPMIAAAAVGHFWLRMNLLSLLGVMTGGMTSTPGLAAVDSMSDSNAPHVSYAAVYPFALVGMILCSQILARLQ